MSGRLRQAKPGRGGGRSKEAPIFFGGKGALASLAADPLVETVREASDRTGSRVYVVGGAVRNLAMGLSAAQDYDFVLEGGAEALSREAARATGGTAFLLDGETGAWRVAVKRDGAPVTLDFQPVSGGGIDSDLKRRDFTVNAMAVSLSSLFSGKMPEVVDPCGGMRDARSKVLRATSAGVFAKDPLRVLRAVRLSVKYGLRIDKDTLARIRRCARLLKRTSAERIRDEMVSIFSSNGTSAGIDALFKTGIIDTVLPEAAGWGGLKGYDLLSHVLKTVDEAEGLVAGVNDRSFPGLSLMLKAHFNGSIGVIRRGVVLKLAAFFHDIGKPCAMKRVGGRLRFIGHEATGEKMVKEALVRLRFSRRAARLLSVLVKNHHRTFMLALLKRPSTRAKAHFFRAVGGDAGVDLLCLALADARATRGGEDRRLKALVTDMLKFYYGVYSKERPRPLLSGNDVMMILRIPEGRLVGSALAGLSGAVENGEVKDRKEAAAFLKRWAKGMAQGN